MSAPGHNPSATQQMLREMVAEAQAMQQAAGGPVTDAVAAWLAPQYFVAVQEKLAAAEGAGRLEVLRTFMHDWAILRRGDHSAARLQLDREELEWQRTHSQAQKEKEFRDWIQRPEIRKEFMPDLRRGLSQETLEKIEREIGLL